MTLRSLALLSLASGCAVDSPLATAQPQVELTANPGGVAGQPRFALTLTTWNHLAALGDAVATGQIEVRLDGEALALASGVNVDNHDHYTATFVLPNGAPRTTSPVTSTVTVADPQTTWSVQIDDLFTNDLAPTGPVLAQGPSTLVWPSAMTAAPWSTIDWVCVDVAGRTAACTQDAGVEISQQLVRVDVPAQPGDRFAIRGQRWAHPVASGDGPTFFASILDQVTGAFE